MNSMENTHSSTGPFQTYTVAGETKGRRQERGEGKMSESLNVNTLVCGNVLKFKTNHTHMVRSCPPIYTIMLQMISSLYSLIGSLSWFRKKIKNLSREKAWVYTRLLASLPLLSFLTYTQRKDPMDGKRGSIRRSE